MTVIPAGTEVSFRITYLEMPVKPRDRPEPACPTASGWNMPSNPPVWFFLSMYDAVGRDYEWRDRFDQAEEDPEPGRLRLGPAGRDVGRLCPRLAAGVLHARLARGRVCDLAYFGWCPRRWAGSGRALLRTALAKGWAREGVAKMTVNTCTLDHPRALGLYRKMGFVPWDRGPHPRPLPGPRHIPPPGLKGRPMFETRLPPEPDKILRLMGMFAADPGPTRWTSASASTARPRASRRSWRR
jgi:GNAT superfamily N-acetyltransferase